MHVFFFSSFGFMEFQFLSSVGILSLLFFVFLMLVKRKSKTQNNFQKLPPGPWKLPIIGSLHHMTGALPHRRLKELAKKYGPIMHLQLGEITAIVIQSSDAAKEVMRTQDLAFATRGEALTAKVLFYDYLGITFSPPEEYWKSMRKLCAAEFLSARHIRKFAAIRNDEAFRLVQLIRSSSGQQINLAKAVLTYSSSVLCRAAFGARNEGQDVLVKVLKDGLAMVGGFDVSELFPSIKLLQDVSGMRGKLTKMHRMIDEVLDNAIANHKAKKAKGETDEENLVDVLLRVKETGELGFPIGINNVKAIMFDIFGAGTETSSSSVVWAMAELMKNPTLMIKAQTEIRQALKGKNIIHEEDIQGLKFLKSVVKETLRMHPPITLTPRECREQCQINGYTIPKKAKIMISLWAIGRDPKYWNDAENFMPERFEDSSIDFLGNNFEYLPFGSGRRICPGISLGQANLELPLAQLLYHFDWKLPNGMKPEELDMSENFGMVSSKKGDLYLIPTPYDP